MITWSSFISLSNLWYLLLFFISGNYTIKGVMHGCNAGVMSVQTDPQVRLYNYWLDTKYTGLVFP